MSQIKDYGLMGVAILHTSDADDGLKSLHAATIAALPENRNKECWETLRDCEGSCLLMNKGYNQAIAHMKAAINELYGVQ